MGHNLKVDLVKHEDVSQIYLQLVTCKHKGPHYKVHCTEHNLKAALSALSNEFGSARFVNYESSKSCSHLPFLPLIVAIAALLCKLTIGCYSELLSVILS